ncbi:hypothetical protein [Bradyrhizobium sp. SZCCHNRI3043]|uniref:hypothetical protein n=1 Tax=Bradyrhizobium sp. SZCCHNRI3043 TaxID=3057292 RepID=UPI0028E24491|nr:hypothetical protein [Bradyrhizobium sp. SZCCHNRI3043]
MITALEKLDSLTAAGVLARAALSLGYASLPEATIAGEDTLRAQVIDEARHKLGIAAGDENAETIEKIADLLDEEADRLLPEPDIKSALQRMAARGDLPSDLYTVEIVPNISTLHGRQFALEEKLIRLTVASPDMEQHFEEGDKPEEPAMASLFGKYIRTRWPGKDFFMLVVGQRTGTRFVVIQAWRVYKGRVDVTGAHDLVDWLKRFSEVYGAEIELNGRKGKFFDYAAVAGSSIDARLNVGGKGQPREVIISHLTRWIGNRPASSLINAIDSDKYMSMLKSQAVAEGDIYDLSVPKAA